jgi:hypothetical protein
MPIIATTVTSAASTSQMAGVLLFDVLAAIAMFVAVVRIVMTPAHLWPHGRLSKTAWIVASLWFAPQFSGVSRPVAAIFAICHTRTLCRRAEASPTVPGLPYAEGSPDDARAEEES